MRQAAPSYVDAISEVADDSIVEGIVAWVQQDGIGVDIGPVTGWAPRSELPVARGRGKLSDVYEPGDVVRVKVLSVDPDKKRAGLSVGRAEPYKYGLDHPKFLVGEQVEARCVKVDDRGAMFKIPGSDLQGLMRVDEFSLEAGANDAFEMGDTITAIVLDVDKDNTNTIHLSLRRAQDGWRDACEHIGTYIRKRETLPGVVVDVTSGGVRVDLGPLTDWVSAADASLDIGASPSATYSVGQLVDVYIVDAWNLGKRKPRLQLSLRRAMAEWPLHVRRVKPGSLMTGQLLPGVVQRSGTVRIDLGPVNARVSAQELTGAAADAYARMHAWNEVNVVVQRFGIRDIEAEVSIEGYEERWAELVENLPVKDVIEAQYVVRTESEVHVDLGSGLLCRVPVSEWVKDAGTAVKGLDSYSVGDPIDVRVVSINKEEQAIMGTLLTQAQREVAELLQSVESSYVEFKPGLRKLPDVDRDMEHEVLKNIVAFLNTDGGDVLIGVTDDGEPLGLVRDGWASIDHAQRHLKEIVNNRIGDHFWSSVSTECVLYAGVDLLRVRCEPLDAGSGLVRLDNTVYVRAASAAQPLKDETAELKHQNARLMNALGGERSGE